VAERVAQVDNEGIEGGQRQRRLTILTKLACAFATLRAAFIVAWRVDKSHERPAASVAGRQVRAVRLVLVDEPFRSAALAMKAAIHW
jgi:hypothetical protein